MLAHSFLGVVKLFVICHADYIVLRIGVLYFLDP